MPKTVFVNGDQSQNIPPTFVMADWLNAVFSHRHDGADADGSAPINYAASGAGNAYAVALVPALTAHVVGMPITFKAGSTNTSYSTLAVNGLAPVAIKKNVSTVVAAGDIVAGQLVTVVYDGTYFQLVNNGQSVDLSMFAKSLATSGYQKLPGGLIVQWGQFNKATGDVLDDTFYSVTFPMTFPNAVYSIAASNTGAIASKSFSTVTGNHTTSGFSVAWKGPAGTNAAGVNYIAIGY